MDVTTDAEGEIAPSILQSPDANDCGKSFCPHCEALKDQLKKLSYCLSVAQRLTIIEAS